MKLHKELKMKEESYEAGCLIASHPKSLSYHEAYSLGMIHVSKSKGTKQQLKDFDLYKQSLAQQEAAQQN